jgi:hypothetical protein
MAGSERVQLVDDSIGYYVIVHFVQFEQRG